MLSEGSFITVYVDADACPVKEEVARVAARHALKVIYVTNQRMRIPEGKYFSLKLVDDQFDAADNWIAENVQPNDIVVTADIPLADRSIKAKAKVVDAKGKILDESNIGSILASRNLMEELRGAGQITGGPAPFSQKDRSEFLQSLEKLIQKIIRS